MEFYKTVMGHRFYEQTMPLLVKRLEEQNTLIDRQNTLIAKFVETMGAGCPSPAKTSVPNEPSASAAVKKPDAKDDRCPVCGGVLAWDGSSNLSDGWISYDWTCPSCNAYGKADYRLEFEGHTVQGGC